MFFGNRCGCRRRCGICGIFGCFGGRRRRFFDDGCGCGFDRFGAGRFERELVRADFDGFYPEARFERVSRECNCGCR